MLRPIRGSKFQIRICVRKKKKIRRIKSEKKRPYEHIKINKANRNTTEEKKLIFFSIFIAQSKKKKKKGRNNL